LTSPPSKAATVADVRLRGARNVPSQLPGQASQLRAANVVALVRLMVADGALAPDLADEVLAAFVGYEVAAHPADVGLKRDQRHHSGRHDRGGGRRRWPGPARPRTGAAAPATVNTVGGLALGYQRHG
jgi:hypothetical protein